MYGVSKGQISLDEVENFLKKVPIEKRKDSDYRRLLCLYDKMKYK